jgi:undecaprenyl-diphosphatase
MTDGLVGKTLLALSFLLLSFLTVLAWEFDHFGWDVVILRTIQSTDISPLDSVLVWMSLLGTGWTPWVLAIVTGLAALSISPSLRRWAIIFWAGLGTGAALMGLIKGFTMRPRPSAPLAQVLIEYPGFSYPSGHVIFFVQYFGFLYLLVCVSTDQGLARRSLFILLSVPISLIGYSRIYIGAHWPSDVIGGYLLGGVLLAMMARSFRE